MEARIPQLSHKDVEQELDELYKSHRKRHLVALYGTGEEAVLDVPNAGRVEVVPVASELDLREQMPPLGSEERRIAFLVPWTGEIPLDLAGRFALSGRIVLIGRDARLGRLFGVREVDSDARASPLAEYLLRDAGPAKYSVTGTRLTLDGMWRGWLAERWSMPTEGGLAADALVGWAAIDPHGERFNKEMARDDAGGVRAALLAYLDSKVGPAARVALGAWEAGRGQEVLEWALLFEILAPKDDAGVRMWVKHAVARAFSINDEEQREALARALGAVAEGAIRHVRRKADDAAARAIIKAADRRIDDSTVREALAEDNRLPSSWQLQLSSLGALLARGASVPSSDLVLEARQRLRKLEAHEVARDPSQHGVVKRAWMAARLMAWLASKPKVFPEPGQHDYADAESLGEWYAAEGGFLDLARRRARRTGDDAFGAGVQAVVLAVDAEREALDRRFAKALAAWVSAGRPANRIVPIDQAVKRIGLAFLEGDERRKLLVLLLDGMAWAQAVEILGDLGSRHAPWGPLAWHANVKTKIGSGPYPTMFANLPTVTEVSRAAFFASKAMPPGKAPRTTDDPDRWRNNKQVAKLLAPTDPPRLLNRAESHVGDGSASQEALSLVGDPERRIVAIIINAIDASLKSDPQQEHEWSVDSIRSLRDLLDKAREAGRAVLMASDHGHVPADRMSYKAALVPEGGARYRPWSSPHDPVQEYEVGIAGSGVFTAKDAHGVVLLADDASRYGSTGAHAGEHGGATLAEVVAPCLLIGCEESLGVSIGEDAAQRVMPAHTPAWWHLDVRPPVADEPVEKKAPTRALPKKQLELPSVAAQAPAPSPLATSKLLEALAPSKELRDKVVRAVAYLAVRNGIASGAAFAEAMGVLPYRVNGFVTTLGEVLNVDGYQVIRFEHDSQQVRLDREVLEQQFEVKL